MKGLLFFIWRNSPPPPVGHGLLIHGVFEITHNDAAQSVGLLWTSDQPEAQTSIWQHTALTTDRHPCRTHNLSSWAARDLRLRPRGHWDRQSWLLQRTDIHIIRLLLNLWSRKYQISFILLYQKQISLRPLHFMLRPKFRAHFSFLHALYTHPPWHHSNGICTRK